MKKKFKVLLPFILICAMCIPWVSVAADSANGLTFESYYAPSTEAQTYPLPCTYEAVITLPSSTSGRGGVIIGNYNSETKPIFNLEIHEKGAPRIYLNAKNASDSIVTYDVKFTNVNIATGEPVHLAITMDQAAGEWHCYVDGQLKQTIKQAMPKQFDLTEALRLGGDFRDGNTQYFKGTIQKVALYSDVRTAQEIAGDATNSAIATDNIICGYDLSTYTPGSQPTKITSVSGAAFDLTCVSEWIKNLPAPENYAYSFAVIGDIQTLTHSYPDQLNTLYKWIRDNAESKKIKFAVGLGDITEKNTDAQYELVKNAYQLIDGVVPFSIIRGNHDRFGASSANYDAYITQTLYGDEITGAYDNTMLNTYRILQVGQVKYLFMNLDYLLKDEVLTWANKVISENSDCHVIVSTHIYMSQTGSYYSLDGSSGIGTKYNCANNGQGLWDKLLSQHENVVMLICGHNPTDDIFYRQKEGVHGNMVTEILIDPQTTDKTYSGTGLVAMFYFSEDGKQLQVQYYSTAKDAYFKENNQFTLTLDVPGDESAPTPPETEPTTPGTEPTTPSTETPATKTIIIVVAIVLAGGSIVAFLLIKKRKKA